MKNNSSLLAAYTIRAEEFHENSQKKYGRKLTNDEILDAFDGFDYAIREQWERIVDDAVCAVVAISEARAERARRGSL